MSNEVTMSICKLCFGAGTRQDGGYTKPCLSCDGFGFCEPDRECTDCGRELDDDDRKYVIMTEILDTWVYDQMSTALGKGGAKDWNRGDGA